VEINADLEAVIKRKLSDAISALKLVDDILFSENDPALCIIEGMVRAVTVVIATAAEYFE
jgi:hypothetical protein